MDAPWSEVDTQAQPSLRERVTREMTRVPYRIRVDEDLVRMAQAGNNFAFDELVARYRDRVYTLALMSLGDEERAGDVVCDTFVSAFRSLGSAGSGCSPRAWFYLHALRAVFVRLGEGRGEYSIERRAKS